jgi:hypothetical protein
MHPNEKFSPMVEYSSLTDRVFKKPTGFIDACRKNPTEVSKYLALNGAINSVILVPGLIRHRSLIMPAKYGKKGEILQIGIFLAIFISGTIAFIVRNNIRRANIKPMIISLVTDTRIIVLLLLPSASTVAILLLIPDPRYWIAFIPALFLWITWSITSLLECVSPRKQLFITIPVITLFSFPMFIGHSSNNRIIYEMRKVSMPDKVPAVGGLYPGGLSFLAFPAGSSIVGVEQLSHKKISGSELDFLFVDKYLRQSVFWDKNRDLMAQFERSPEQFGYRKLAESTDKHESVVYARNRTR